MAVAPTTLALLLLCALWAPTADAVSARDAWAYCQSIGWAIDSTHSTNAIICTKRGTSWSDNCNSCTSWRLVVYANGGYDYDHAGQTYQTLAGQYYGGHSRCTPGWNLPHCGQWAATPAPPTPPPTPTPPTPTPPTPVPQVPTLQAATAYCNGLGWTVTTHKSTDAIICTAPGTTWGNVCNSCTTWRLVVYADGGSDYASLHPANTLAGLYYGGHMPCAGGPVQTCGQWTSGGTPTPPTPAPPPTPVPTPLPAPIPGLTQQDATAYCNNLGWTVSTVQTTNALICTAPGTSWSHNCNSCTTWRLVVWADGGHDGASGGQTYYTVAGYAYGGHSPCTGGWNLPSCGQWAP